MKIPFSLLLLFVLTLNSRAAARVSTPAPCCEEKPAVTHASHGDVEKSPGFSRDSLYQMEATFVDDSGRSFTLGELRGRPVMLTLFFSSCGYACPLLLGDLQRIRAALPAEVRATTRLVLVSFDVRRDTPEALAAFRKQRNLDDGFILLHAEAAGVSELAALLGVKYKEEADGNFAHSNVITVLNPAGEIVHQRLGLRDGLAEATSAVVLASNSIASPQ